MKGLILCAGKGTRMQPFSHATPKTLLPVANRTLLEHGIRKLIEVGITEIGVVIHPAQASLREWIASPPVGGRVQAIVQRQPLGIAHAVGLARSFVGEEPFVLLLGDNLIGDPLDGLVRSLRGNDAALMLARVENPSDYGVAELNGAHIVSLEEKPEQPKSDLAVIGAYAFTSRIFEAIRNLKPSARGEFEITDAIQWLIQHDGSVTFSITERPYSDVGTAQRWLAANRWLLDEELGENVRIGANTKLKNCVLHGPVMIGEGCLLQNAVIGPHVSVGDGCKLVDCHVEESICLEGAEIRQVEGKIARSIFGRGAHLYGAPKDESQDESQGAGLRCLLGDHSQLKLPRRQT